MLQLLRQASFATIALTFFTQMPLPLMIHRCARPAREMMGYLSLGQRGFLEEAADHIGARRAEYRAFHRLRSAWLLWLRALWAALSAAHNAT